jgi:hypothetical protein
MGENNSFPTGKAHVSFSEVRIWKECGWKHKLMYIDKIVEDEPSVYLDYGTIIHDALEHYLKTRELKIDESKESLRKAWKTHSFDAEDSIKRREMIAESQGWKYRHNYLDDWLRWSENSLRDIGPFLDKNYPEWEFIAAEEQLYEPIDDEISFKGFIDGVIKYKKGNREKYVIIDWKTASARGWHRDKKRDFKTTAQLILYKHYWCEKNDVKLRDVACNFVLLKRGAKPGKICAIVDVSAGEKSIVKANKMVSSMMSSVRKNRYLKNRFSCKFCPYYNTEHCT